MVKDYGFNLTPYFFFHTGMFLKISKCKEGNTLDLTDIRACPFCIIVNDVSSGAGIKVGKFLTT